MANNGADNQSLTAVIIFINIIQSLNSHVHIHNFTPSLATIIC